MIKQEKLSSKHHELIVQIGKKLKLLRKTKGISYTETAEAIDISRNTYNQIEMGKKNFQFSTLLQILDYHKISVSEFFEDIENL